VEVAGYTKLFSSILMSSIWEESTETRLVWVTLLALADQNGHVDGTVKSLARVSRVSLEDCQKALDCLLGPDPLDRSGVMDGRRIVVEQGGWRLVNHAAYRAKMSADERRARDKERKREKRSVSAGRPQTSEFVRNVSQAEAEAEAKAEQKQNTSTTPAALQGGGGLLMSPSRYHVLKEKFTFVGNRLRIPHVLHDELRTKLGGESPDTALSAWYAALDAEAEQTKAPIPDVFKWVRPKFEAWASEQEEAATWAAMERQAREQDAADAARRAARRG
jgi:hypothetical protein